MPCFQYDDSSAHQSAWKLARNQVKAKFPMLLEGSSGWHRAVKNRYDRNLGK